MFRNKAVKFITEQSTICLFLTIFPWLLLKTLFFNPISNNFGEISRGCPVCTLSLSSCYTLKFSWLCCSLVAKVFRLCHFPVDVFTANPNFYSFKFRIATGVLYKEAFNKVYTTKLYYQKQTMVLVQQKCIALTQLSRSKCIGATIFEAVLMLVGHANALK